MTLLLKPFLTDRTRLFLVLIFLLFRAEGDCQQQAKARTLIVVFDGLRPDYVKPDLMPHLYAFRSQGVYGTHHHSVFPTVTRVNASSYATGSYPAKHGLMGNTVYFPAVEPARGLNTADAKTLMAISKATGNRLLTSVSLGELLHAAGESMMVFSSGSSGQAFLQHHTVSGGAVINPEVILPVSMEKILFERIGPPPPAATPNTAQHDWATRALLEFALNEKGPLVSAIWFSDPDATAHDEGMGHPLSMEAIRMVDEQFGVILKTLERRNLLPSFNIIVTADHGFVTHAGSRSIGEFLIQKGLKTSEASDDVVLAGNALYVKDHNRDLIQKVVSALQEQPWVGAIFTAASKKNSMEGWVPGTLSFNSIHWDHERAADILVDYNWDARKNSYGYEGTSFSRGVAGHGGASPYEIHIPLVASGPAFKNNFESPLPTSNIDIVPTILHIHKLDVRAEMDGRIMHELLNAAPVKPEAVRTDVTEVTAKHKWGTYRIMLQRSVVGEHQYVDFVKVVRGSSGE